jgi:hypothetical protein
MPDELDADECAGMLAAADEVVVCALGEPPPPHPAIASAATTTAAHARPQAERSLLLIISVRPPSHSLVRDRRRFDLVKKTRKCPRSFLARARSFGSPYVRADILDKFN